MPPESKEDDLHERIGSFVSYLKQGQVHLYHYRQELLGKVRSFDLNLPFAFFRQLHGSYDVAFQTLQLLRRIVSQTRWSTAG